jgi:hypothetical protein
MSRSRGASLSCTCLKQDEVRRINSDLQPNVPTADLAIYLPSNLDKSFLDGFSLDGLLEQVVRAKELFGAVGVQLNLLFALSTKASADVSIVTLSDNVGVIFHV